ncbi:MAG: 16S rRNA processing protein RimM [Bacteriovoracaceae bacterium]|nr:16S rRNA processing protein RimM [Bacteriovoracaceae bacterium]
MKHDLVEIARISSPKGLKGKMWITPYGDSPERFSSYTHLIIGDEKKPRKVLSCTPHKGRFVLELEGINDIDTVETLRGETLFITEDQLEPLDEEEYYWRDLIGLKVVDENGREIGEIVKIFSTGSNDVYVVDPVKEYYIPATKDVIKEISPEKGTVLIDASLLEDLLD